MLVSSLVLALSSSIDALGIGITYGIRNTKISFLAKIILLIISLVVSFLSIWFGDIIKNVLPDFVTKLFGNFNVDLYDSNSIDGKEALFLGFALSLDCFCIGSCGSALGMNSFWFHLFISVLQFVFLSVGNALGKRLQHLANFPNNIWSFISGILLVFIGLVRFVSF